MSSPVDNTLREQPCTSTTYSSISFHDAPQLHKEQVIHRKAERSNPKLVDQTLDLLLGSSKRKHKRSPPGLKELEDSLSKMFENSDFNAAPIESSSMRHMLALICLANNKELEACCHLIASHASVLRQQIYYRYLKSKLRADLLKQPMIDNLNPYYLEEDQYNPKKLVSTLEELPTEWYVVQVTAEHEHLKDMRHRFQNDENTYSLKPTHGLHIVVLPTGENAINPICISLPKPNVESTYDIRIEIEKLLNNNRTDLTATYSSKMAYWKMRNKQNGKLSVAIWELEHSWLREWRVLFVADYTENLDLVQDIHNMIDKLIFDAKIKNVTERTRWLLKKIATGACYLKPFEIERAVKHVLPTQTKLAKNIILSIIAKSKVMDRLKESKRKTLVLILDESIDCLPFESIQLLKYQAVTRIPSLHILYALFKKHKSSIKDGYKIIRQSDKLGTFIINPSLDLGHMEIRMRAFMDYWLPKWEGLYGIQPDLEFFKKSLTDYSVLMYSGHGSGIQYLRGEEIERMRVFALVLLFGCCSIKLLPMGGRQASFGVSNQYLMASSPCMLGTLWEVTDGDIDRMTTDFMSLWFPSSAKRAWSDVDDSSWNKGLIKFNKNPAAKIVNEQDMLICVAKSKDACKQLMTSAAVISRGLPIKLIN